MAVNQTLLDGAEEIRDASAVGENTALRVGTELVGIVQEIGDVDDKVDDLDTDLDGKTDKNANTLRLDHSQAPVVVLDSMGTTLDSVGSSTPVIYMPKQGDYVWATNSLRYYKVYNGPGNPSTIIDLGQPQPGLVYANRKTGRQYVWNTSTSSWDEVGANLLAIVSSNVELLLTSLANYCFPGGKPVLNWNEIVVVPLNITMNLTDLTSDAPASVDYGDSLEVQLSVPDNLYIIDDDSVVVTMGGVTQVGAYDPATGKVTIASVTADVEITANGLTYVQDGLVLMFDGKNKGGTAGQWQDLADTNRAVVLAGGYTENSDNVEFDGTGYGSGNFVDDVVYNQSTVECVIKQTNKTTPSTQAILLPGKTGAPALVLFPVDANIDWTTHVKEPDASISVTRSVYRWNGVLDTKYSISYYGNSMLQNGTKLTAVSGATSRVDSFNVTNHKDKTFIGAQITAGNDKLGFVGNIYCVRMYSRVLTDEEALQNWKVDQKRFNFS